MIRRIRIRQFRGIEELDASIPPAGAVVKGRNTAGKTSVLRAIRAALEAQDIGPDAIRKGADRAEIYVDIDALQVRRAITSKGSSVVVAQGEMRATKPQTMLNELLGNSSLDPMELLMLSRTAEDRRKRRALILASIPMSVTLDVLRTWVPRLKDDFDCSGHALEVIERLRKTAYAQRTAANAATDAQERLWSQAQLAADAAAQLIPKEPLDLLEALRERKQAEEALAAMEQRAAEALLAEQRTASVRKRVLDLKEQAAFAREQATHGPTWEQLSATSDAKHQAAEEVRRLETLLQAAILRYKQCEADDVAMLARREASARQLVEAESLEAQASELANTLALAAVPPVDPAELAQARDRRDAAQTATDTASEHAAAKQRFDALTVESQIRKKAYDEALVESSRLQDIVVALTKVAPVELLKHADGIPGLSLDGEEVLLDSVRLDSLSGAEQIQFCVEVARRANSKSKILVVDGLERLDPDQYKTFVTLATKDGWQLLGTRVSEGELLVEAITDEAQQ